MNGAALVLARYYAGKAVAAEIRRQGRKPQYIEPREVALHARLYLDQHPELVELARANLSTHAQRSKP